MGELGANFLKLFPPKLFRYWYPSYLVISKAVGYLYATAMTLNCVYWVNRIHMKKTCTSHWLIGVSLAIIMQPVQLRTITHLCCTPFNIVEPFCVLISVLCRRWCLGVIPIHIICIIVIELIEYKRPQVDQTNAWTRIVISHYWSGISYHCLNIMLIARQ